MGTGTGLIAIYCQYLKLKNKNFNPKIYASDILEEAISCAKKNETLNNFLNEIVFLQSDLFKNFPESLKSSFNIIIFNPPYLPSSTSTNENNQKEMIDYSWDGGPNGYEILIEFIKEARSFLNLKKAHFLYFISSSRTNLDILYEYINELGYENEIVDKKHIFFEDIILNRVKMLHG
jgi:release factor glutamine methyltransferase